jgi:hypothetical protein
MTECKKITHTVADPNRDKDEEKKPAPQLCERCGIVFNPADPVERRRREILLCLSKGRLIQKIIYLEKKLRVMP